MNSQWQTTRSTIKERSQYMYKNELYSDVEFSVVNSNGDAVTIPAHKYTLAIGSPVFGAMFFGELAETSRTISLPDCTAEGLLELFRYMYYDEVELTGSVVMEVLYLAKKYIVPSLDEKCTHYLEEELGPEDVLSVLPEVEKLGDEKIQNICWKIVDEETQRAVTSAPFFSVTQDKLCDILKRDSLQITELELFQAVNCWAENKIQEQKLDKGGPSKRAVLGDKVIHLIRFPLMSASEFVDNVLSTEILDMKEVTEVWKYHSSAHQPSLKIFTGETRVPVAASKPAIHVCKRFGKILGICWGNGSGRKREDSIVFSTDRKIHLTGLTLFGNTNNEFKVEFSIHGGGQTLVTKDQQQYTSGPHPTDGYACFTIKLDKPLCINANIEYTIQAYIEGPKSQCGDDGKESVQCKKVTFTFKAKPGSELLYHSTQKYGQFQELLFY